MIGTINSYITKLQRVDISSKFELIFFGSDYIKAFDVSLGLLVFFSRIVVETKIN